MIAKPKALLSWSSGKDSAWALHVLRQRDEVEVVGLVTTFNVEFDRVAMHGVRRELVEAQAELVGIPLWPVFLRWPCSNIEYELLMRALIDRAVEAGITHFAFGDLFLEDIRRYRERQLAGTGLAPIFPIWTTRADTDALAHCMIGQGLRATVICVDPRQLPKEFAGREFDGSLLNDLPRDVDRCGERGEFHTFCYASPQASRSIPIEVGQSVERDGFWFTDLLPRRSG